MIVECSAEKSSALYLSLPKRPNSFLVLAGKSARVFAGKKLLTIGLLGGAVNFFSSWFCSCRH
jgi:hypothetical protein